MSTIDIPIDDNILTCIEKCILTFVSECHRRPAGLSLGSREFLQMLEAFGARHRYFDTREPGVDSPPLYQGIPVYCSPVDGIYALGGQGTAMRLEWKKQKAE